jgi:hypothetical protein
MLRGKDYFPVSVRYADFNRHHKSLIGMWNDWYNEYKNVSFQRLFVRYEDLLFHPKAVAETVCHCAGGTMNRGKFQYVVDSAKKGIGAHGSVRTGYVDAIIKYGSDRSRYKGYYPEDLVYTRENLDPILMEEFGYQYHPESLEKINDNQDEGEGNGGNEHEDEEEEIVEHEEEREVPEIPEDGEEKEVGKDGDTEDQSGDEEKDPERSADLGEKDNLLGEGGEDSGEEDKNEDGEVENEVEKSADVGEKEDLEEDGGDGEEDEDGGESGEKNE